MAEYTICTEMLPGRRLAKWVWVDSLTLEHGLIEGPECLPAGRAICVSKSWSKNGKWSGWTMNVRAKDTVYMVSLAKRLHQNEWGDHLESWEKAAESLDLPLQLCKVVVVAYRPESAKRFDEIEAFAV